MGLPGCQKARSANAAQAARRARSSVIAHGVGNDAGCSFEEVVVNYGLTLEVRSAVLACEAKKDAGGAAASVPGCVRCLEHGRLSAHQFLVSPYSPRPAACAASELGAGRRWTDWSAPGDPSQSGRLAGRQTRRDATILYYACRPEPNTELHWRRVSRSVETPSGVEIC
jgi:hypothetical protein